MSNFPTSYEYIIDNIKEDYEYFNISYSPNNSKIKCQNKYCELSKMSFKALFQFEVYENFEDSYYNKYIYLTKEILDDITNNTKDIVNLDLYKLILFINICKSINTRDNQDIPSDIMTFQEFIKENSDKVLELSKKGLGKNELYPEYQKYVDENNISIEENQEKYALYDEEHDIYDIKKYKLFYDNEFTQYFNNKYKENSTIINDKMSRLNLFNYHYDKIYPHNYNKVDNPKEYNNVSKNKSNLKTQYRKYLDGEDISKLKNIPALKMIIYIIENVTIEN